MPAALLEVSPYDPVTSAVVVLRATTADDDRVCALNGLPWFPVLMKAGSFGLDLFDAGFPGFASTPTARVELDLSAFPDAARYSWGDRPVKIWTGEPGTAWPWAALFDGLVQAATVREGRLALTLRVNDAWLDRPVLGSYAGTGGVEGAAALKGAPKPLALGAPKYVAPQLVDAVNNVWQFHGSGAARAVTAALDRLVRYPDSIGDFANFGLLVAAAIPPGSFATCLAAGLVRFGAPPAGPLTLIVEGDTGSAEGWVRRPGALIRRIALLAGATAGQLDAANLAALDAGAPYNLSLFVNAQTTARDLISRVAAGVNGLAMVNLLGRLQVILPGIGAPVLTLAADGSAEPQVTGLDLLETGAPWWRTQMAGDTCWRPHTDGEFYDAGAAEWNKISGPGKPEDGADVTATAVPTLSVPAAIVVKCDSAGNALAGQLPRELAFRRRRGDVDVSATTTWALTATGCTATIDPSGTVTVTAIAADGKVRVTADRDGVTLAGETAVTRELAAPTAGRTVSATISGGSYGGATSGPFVVRTGSAGQLVLAFSGSFSVENISPNGTFGMAAKVQWRAIGGSFADAGAEQAESSLSSRAFDTELGANVVEPGALSLSRTVTGLLANTDYEVQLLARNANGTGAATRPRGLSGTFSAVAT